MGVFYILTFALLLLLLAVGCGAPPRITQTEIDAGVEFEIAIKAPSILGAYLPQLILKARGYEGLKEYTWELGNQ